MLIDNYIVVCLLTMITLFSCDQQRAMKNRGPENRKETSAHEKESIAEELPNNIRITANFCGSEKILSENMVIWKNGEKIYKADALLQFVFSKQEYPLYVKDSSYEYVLLERHANFDSNIYVYRINSDNEVDTMMVLPYFYHPGLDTDKDGKLEYWSYLNVPKYINDEVFTYVPILVYEIGEGYLSFDSIATKYLNTSIYGQYHGLNNVDSLRYNKDTLYERWPVEYK